MMPASTEAAFAPRLNAARARRSRRTSTASASHSTAHTTTSAPATSHGYHGRPVQGASDHHSTGWVSALTAAPSPAASRSRMPQASRSTDAYHRARPDRLRRAAQRAGAAVRGGPVRRRPQWTVAMAAGGPGDRDRRLPPARAAYSGDPAGLRRSGRRRALRRARRRIAAGGTRRAGCCPDRLAVLAGVPLRRAGPPAQRGTAGVPLGVVAPAARRAYRVSSGPGRLGARRTGAGAGRRLRSAHHSRTVHSGRVRRHAGGGRGPGDAAGGHRRAALPRGVRVLADHALRGLGRLPAPVRAGRHRRVRGAGAMAARLASLGPRRCRGGRARGAVRQRRRPGPHAVRRVRQLPRVPRVSGAARAAVRAARGPQLARTAVASQRHRAARGPQLARTAVASQRHRPPAMTAKPLWRMVTGERIPLVQVVKTALATTLAWAAAELVAGHQLPFFAALAALLAVQPSIAQSLSRGLERFAGVIGGVTLAYLLGRLLGVHVWTVGLLILAGLLMGWLLRLGPQGAIQIPISALLVVAVGAGAPGYIEERVVDTALGAAIGVAINALVVPPE